MKKILGLALSLVLVVGCSNTGNEQVDVKNDNNVNNEVTESTEGAEVQQEEPVESQVKVGLVVTHDEAIEDRSFIEGTWNGMQKNATSLDQEVTYIVSSSKTTPDYESAIDSLINSGYSTIVLVGYEFIEAINNSSATNPEVEYIIIDEFIEGDNIKSVVFSEEEGGFIGGLTAALSSESGKVGFIGGMEIPPVKKYAVGFEAGVKYAKEVLGAEIENNTVIFEGSFDNVPGGASLAAGLYDQGVDVIMHAAGGVGIGVINEAMERSDVWVIGVDIDQYDLGKKDDGSSVILTSSMKNVDVAVGEVMKQLSDGSYEGGQSYKGNINNGGISLPESNPNLDSEVENTVKEIMAEIVAGDLVIPSDDESLASFLNN